MVALPAPLSKGVAFEKTFFNCGEISISGINNLGSIKPAKEKNLSALTSGNLNLINLLADLLSPFLINLITLL